MLPFLPAPGYPHPGPLCIHLGFALLYRQKITISMLFTFFIYKIYNFFIIYLYNIYVFFIRVKKQRRRSCVPVVFKKLFRFQ